jgi:hypothetical protein
LGELEASWLPNIGECVVMVNDALEQLFRWHPLVEKVLDSFLQLGLVLAKLGFSMGPNEVASTSRD